MDTKKIENRIVPRTISMPVWMVDHLEEDAKRQGLSVSAVIRDLVKNDYNSKNGADRDIFMKKPGPVKNT